MSNISVENISFSLKKGQTLGIIGPTGAGKTTLIALLMRQYDVTSGTVRIDGRDVRSMSRDEISKKFGAAFQNDFLFADTISENISFGRSLSNEKIIDAAKIAQAHDFISAFAKGYDHLLSQKATNISFHVA